MKPTTVLMFAAVAILLGSSVASATSTKRDLHIRGKRSFSWIPFFGRSSTSDSESENESDESIPQPPQYASDGSIVPDASAINAIVARGQLINNQVHYPIWRVHKYNGIHLRPLPVSLVQDQQHQQHRVNLPSYDEPENNSIGSTDGNRKGPIPLELLGLAKQFGITDFSQLPDLEEAMNLLGTTTQEETIQTIKEIAATEDGRELIKQFIGGNRDKEAAASAKEEDTVEGDGTVNVAQYLLPQQNGGSLLSAFVPRDNVDGEEPTPSNPNFFQRITQIGNFLNPFAGREEIPLPPNDAVSEDADDDVIITPNEHAINSDTIRVPQLPDLPALPSIRGVNANVPELPEVHIPRRSIAPRGGAYVRVKLPLSGFNPTPSIPIDPKYLYHYQNQLQRQQQQFHLLQQQLPRQQYQPYNGHIAGNGPVVAQQFTIPTDPRHRAAQTAYNVGQLPLVRDANYEVFKNAPRITTSYGAPALPYTYSLDKSVNTFQPSPHSSNSFIHQEFELRPAGSERVEQTSQPPNSDTDQVNRPDKTQNQNKEAVPRSPNEGIAAAVDAIVPVNENIVEVVTPEALKSLSNASSANSIVAAEEEQKQHQQQQQQQEQRLVGPQRITPFDTFATGKVHKADPKAMELLPFTVRHMLDAENFEQQN